MTLFANGRIWTGAPAGVVEALLVEDGRVRAAGTLADLRRMSSGAAEVDLEGRFCMPGLNDAHLHLGEAARLARAVDLGGARSLDEALERVAAAAKAAAPGAWLTGGGWDESLWPGCPLPTRAVLDRVTAGHPAVFARVDVHVSAANTEALRQAGVTRHTVAPNGGSLDRDEAGEPTGILREQPARLLVERLIPETSQPERERGLAAVLARAARLGVTSVQDFSVDADVAALRALHGRDAMPVRVSEWLPFDATVDELHDRQAAMPQDRRLRTTMLKAFLDGSLGSRTAALDAPYSDDAATQGMLLYEPARLLTMTRERAQAGFQLGFHAIGDRALAQALDAFAFAGEGVARARRFRVEHAQMAAPGAFDRAAALGVIASVQPCHLLSDARWARERLGGERWGRAYAWRSFARAGVPLALGTDLPVEPLDPFRNLAAAVFREDGQQLTLEEALRAYTQGSACAEHAETWKGTLAPGMVADFIELDRDLPACAHDAAAVRGARVVRTWVDGLGVGGLGVGGLGVGVTVR